MGQQAAPGAAILWAQPPTAGKKASQGTDAYEPPQQFVVEPVADGAYGTGAGSGYGSADAYAPVRDQNGAYAAARV